MGELQHKPFIHLRAWETFLFIRSLFSFPPSLPQATTPNDLHTQQPSS